MRGSVISALYLHFSGLINQETCENKKLILIAKFQGKELLGRQKDRLILFGGDSRKVILRETGSTALPMILVRNQMRNMLGGETDKITFGRI